MQEHFIDSDTYNRVLSDLETVARSFEPAAPDMLRSAIAQILGEGLGIWPQDIVKEQPAKTPRLAA